MRIAFRNLDITIQKDRFKGIFTAEEKRRMVDSLWFCHENSEFRNDLWDKLYQALYKDDDVCWILIQPLKEIAFFINEAF